MPIECPGACKPLVPSSRILRTLFVGSLLVPLGLTVGVAAASYQGREYSLLILYALAGYWIIPVLVHRGNGGKMFLSLAVLNMLVLTPELILHQRDFHYELGVQFGYPRPAAFETMLPDAELFWKLPPNQGGTNALGFRGPDWAIPKPSGVHRVMFLGDSVPGQYIGMVELLLNAEHLGPWRVESVNLSVEGYSSHQGRLMADRYGALLDPDVVIVSYGWNDHWLAYGATDSTKLIDPNTAPPASAVQAIYRHVRLLQWLRSLLVPLLGSQHQLAVPRVSLAEYRDNLSHIGDFFAARNVPVIFITPPTTHDLLGVPDLLVASGFARDKASVLALHHAYNAVVREVASGQHGLLLLDLAAETLPPDNLRQAFLADGIHLTPTGAALVARRLADVVAARLLAGEADRGPGWTALGGSPSAGGPLCVSER